MTAIHQFLPTFAAHDAIGMHVRRLQRLLRGAGYVSEIFAEHTHPEVRHQALPYEQYGRSVADGSPTWLLYQASTGSPMAEFLRAQGKPLLVNYHNVTLPRFFDRWEPLAANNMRAARQQLRQLAPVTTLGIAVSGFNEDDLVAAGFRRTTVVPVLVDFAEYDASPDVRTLARLRRERERGGPHWLFVGRVAPNKCQHDVVAAFAAYRRVFEPRARLFLVGGRTSQLYWKALEAMIAQLGLEDAVELADSVPFAQLLAYYRTADVFVCLSEHEGFCVPVLEAMHFEVPVVAHATSALPETVGDAGVVLADKDPLVVATAVDRVLSDGAVRHALVTAGRRRVQHYSFAETSGRMLSTIAAEVERDAGDVAARAADG